MPVPEEKKNTPAWNSATRLRERRDRISEENGERLNAQARPDRINHISLAAGNAKADLNRIIAYDMSNAELNTKHKNAAREVIAVLIYAEMVAREKAMNPNEVGPIAKRIEGMNENEIYNYCRGNKSLNAIIDRELPDFDRQTLDELIMEGKAAQVVDNTILHSRKRAALVENAKAVMAPMSALEGARQDKQSRIDEALEALIREDKGVAFGSKAYDDVIKNVKAFKALWSVESAVADPDRWIAACNALDTVADTYLKTKQDENGVLKNGLSNTTLSRYNVVSAVKNMTASFVSDLRAAKEKQTNILNDNQVNENPAEPENSINRAITHLPKATVQVLQAKQKMDDIAYNLKAADKGVTLGSQEYTDAMEAFTRATADWNPQKEAENPEKTVSRMRTALHTIDTYLDYKGDPTKLTGTAKNRVDAMTRAKKFLNTKIAQMETTYNIPKEKIVEKPDVIKRMERLDQFLGFNH